MNYSVYILRRAQKELAEVPQKNYIRIRNAIRALASNPRPSGCRKLTARESWRIRVGNYRVIYETDDKKRIITVFHIGHRRDIYR